jgi:hypothetical protein
MPYMKRLSLGLMCAIVVSGVAAGADTIYRDNANGFELLQPNGWRIDIPPRPSTANAQERAAIRLRAADASVSGEACVVGITETPETRNIAQADIDRAVRDKSFAKSQLAELQRADPSARILSLHFASENGLTEVDTEAALQMQDAEGIKAARTTRTFYLFTPPRMYSVSCFAKPDSYTAKRNDFDRIIRSFRLLAR